MSRSHPYERHVVKENFKFDSMHPEYNENVSRRRDRSKKADEMETLQLTKFTSNPMPIDYVVFIACHGLTVDKFTFGSRARHVAKFPFETVLGSHLGMPVLRYKNHALYDWMCTEHIPQIIDNIKGGGAYTGEAIFQEDGLFENIFTAGSPKKIRFAGETTADLNLFIPEPDILNAVQLQLLKETLTAFMCLIWMPPRLRTLDAKILPPTF